MGSTSATQNEKEDGSVGIVPYVLLRRWTTHGAMPRWSLSRKALHVAMSSSFVGCVGRVRVGDVAGGVSDVSDDGSDSGSDGASDEASAGVSPVAVVVGSGSGSG